MIPVKRIAKAVSIIQYAGASYYHYLLEAMGRLILLSRILQDDDSIMLIMPRDVTSNHFVSNLLNQLPFKIPKERIVEYDVYGPNDVRLVVDELYYANWGKVGADFPVHCLPPRSVIRRVRNAFVPNSPTTRKTVIYTTRTADKMRKVTEEEALTSAIRNALPEGYELVLFSGTEWTSADTIALFSHAIAVVGTHGGALSNVVFCGQGALLLELGFNSPITRHYAHAAMVC